MAEGELQFDHAEYEATGAIECALCKKSATRYFELDGKRFCETCREGLPRWRPGTPSNRFWRAMALGTGAGVLGTLLYLGVSKLTGYELGLIAILVGVGVGLAVRKGSYNMGGAGYQVMAIMLTWASISAAYYVLLVNVATAQGNHLDAGGYLILVPVAFAVPFLGAANGNVLGLVIVGFGLYEAWKINKRPQLAFTGPHEVRAPAPAPQPQPDAG